MAGDAGLLHALMLVVWVPAVLAWRALDRAWAGARAHAQIAVVAVVVALTYLAGLIHLVVLPEHARESALYGAFFAVAAAGQLGYTVVLASRPTRRLLEVGALAQLGLVVLWALTRTVGPPLGPEAWQAEPLGFLDVLCAFCEAGAVGGALLLLWRERDTPAPREKSRDSAAVRHIPWKYTERRWFRT